MKKIAAYFRLWGEKEDLDKLHEKVLADSRYQGTNLWILIFALLVASISLNLDSIPVVIGAMLISPLMGPINGMGFGIATNDMQLLKTGAYNLAFAVVASIVASALYFLLSSFADLDRFLAAALSHKPHGLRRYYRVFRRYGRNASAGQQDER